MGEREAVTESEALRLLRDVLRRHRGHRRYLREASFEECGAWPCRDWNGQEARRLTKLLYGGGRDATAQDAFAASLTGTPEERQRVLDLRTAVHEMLSGLWECTHGYGWNRDGALCEDVAICIAEGGGFAERLWAIWAADRQDGSESRPECSHENAILGRCGRCGQPLTRTTDEAP